MCGVNSHRLLGPTVALSALYALSTHATAQEQPAKAVIALVGDAERFNIGQDGYCGARSEVSPASPATFRVPAGVQTFFFIRFNFREAYITHYCEGDYSFLPEAGKLHIIRYSMAETKCWLELFKSDPGGVPVPMEVRPEEPRSCLFRKP